MFTKTDITGTDTALGASPVVPLKTTFTVNPSCITAALVAAQVYRANCLIGVGYDSDTYMHVSGATSSPQLSHSHGLYKDKLALHSAFSDQVLSSLQEGHLGALSSGESSSSSLPWLLGWEEGCGGGTRRTT
jgi:hypothetical protein